MDFDKQYNYLILGAGEPHRGKQPAVLCEASPGKIVLNLLLESLECDYKQLTFVAGYKANQIKNNFPELEFLVNPNWEKMGSCGSLFYFDFDVSKPLILTYGDILYRSNLVKKIKKSDKDIAFAWDSSFRSKSSSKEKFKTNLIEKVNIKANNVLRLGTDIPDDWADGEFIGLLKFSPKVLKEIKELKINLVKSLEKLNLSSLVEYLRSTGKSLEGFDVKGDWVEVNISKDIASFIFGTKAETLRRLRRYIKCSSIQDQITFNKIEWKKREDDIEKKIRKHFKVKSKNFPKLIVRSSSRNEDTFETANAGKYKSLLNVDVNINLRDSIEEVIKSFGDNGSDYDQILVQPMLENVIASGVAVTRTIENAKPWYVINYSEGNDTTLITSGKSHNHKTFIFQRDINNLVAGPPWIKKLYSSLKEIEEILGYDYLDIEFAITSNENIVILQVRPITNKTNQEFQDSSYKEFFGNINVIWDRLKTCPPHIPGNAIPMYGVMTDWNPAEIIGTSPGELALSLYKYLITDDVWAIQRAEFGYRDVRPAPLLVKFAGRPYVDVRLSISSFIPKQIESNLAGKLLNFYLDYLSSNPQFHDKLEFNIIPTCISENFREWEKILLIDAKISKENIRIYREELELITKNAFSFPNKALKKIEILEKRQLSLTGNKNLLPLEKARIMLDNCRLFGTLPFAHLARCAFIAVDLLNSAEKNGIISVMAKNSFLNSIRTISHKVGEDFKDLNKKKISLDKFLKVYGHLRPGTYDINSERYDASPDYYFNNYDENSNLSSFNDYDLGPWLSERSKFFDSIKSLNLISNDNLIEKFLRDSIEGREYAKFVFTKSLSDAMEELVKIGEEYQFSREELSYLSLNDIYSLRDNSIKKNLLLNNFRNIIEKNKQDKKLSSNFELPPLLTKKSDLESFFIGKDIPNFIGDKKITAECINIKNNKEINTNLLKDKIVIIKQADPGFDWLFLKGIVGLITQYGGMNSHMAIRSAEYNLSAAIGVGENTYKKIVNSKILLLDPKNKVLKNL